MKTPHIHAEQIKAWADGAEIQWSHDGHTNWRSADTPRWDSGTFYRVKPKPKPNVVRWHAVYANGFTAQGCLDRSDACTSVTAALLRVEIDHNDSANPVLVSATFEKP